MQYVDNKFFLALSRESSRDDINSISDQQFDFEERFKVDRRKLELMMIGSGGKDKICFLFYYIEFLFLFGPFVKPGSMLFEFP